MPPSGKGAFLVVTQGRGLPLPAEGNHIFCVPSRETVRILASPFGGGVRAQRRTERVNKEDPLSRLRRQLSQRESQVPSQSASLTALPEGEPRNFCKSLLPKKDGGSLLHYSLLPIPSIRPAPTLRLRMLHRPLRKSARAIPRAGAACIHL